MNIRHIGRAMLAVWLAAALASACSQQPEAAPVEPASAATPEPVEDIPPPLPEPEPEPTHPFFYPFTGIGADEPATERPIVVMVENSPAARPQTGLHEADFVYEVLAEGDITRFIAVYHSTASEEIGPVRSIRPYFVELGAALDGILVHAGWSQEAMNLMVKGKLNHLDQVYGDHDYYWRDSSRKAPHNLYTSTELIRKGALERKFRAEWNNPVADLFRAGQEETETASSGQPAAEVTIPYLASYSVGYTYDADTGVYLRLMKGEPHLDKKTETRLSAANVLVVETKHRVVDDVGRRAVNVFGPGAGYLLQNGVLREVTWELKDGVIRPYEIAADSDTPTAIPFVPGKTWVQIVPDLSKVTFE